MTNPTDEIDTSNHGLRLNLNMLHDPATALARGEGLFVNDESAKAAIKAATDAIDPSGKPAPVPDVPFDVWNVFDDLDFHISTTKSVFWVLADILRNIDDALDAPSGCNGVAALIAVLKDRFDRAEDLARDAQKEVERALAADRKAKRAA